MWTGCPPSWRESTSGRDSGPQWRRGSGSRSVSPTWVDSGRPGRTPMRPYESPRRWASNPTVTFNRAWLSGSSPARRGISASRSPASEGVLEVGRHRNLHLMDEAAMGWLGYAHLLAGRLSEAVAVLDGPLSV